MLLTFLFGIAFSQISISTIKLSGEGLKEIINQLIEDNQLECSIIQIAIQRGFGQYILDLIQQEQIILKDHLQCAQATILQDISNFDQFKRTITQSDNKIIIKPVILWAQSKTNLFIKVKFAHRIDAPAYISVKNHQVNCLNNQLNIKAESDQNNIQTEFILSIQLFKNVISDINWQIESVGTMVLNLTKIEPKLWLQLSINKEDKFQIWWDLKKQIGKDMDDFSRMLELNDNTQTKKKISTQTKKNIVQTNKSDQFSFFNFLKHIFDKLINLF